MRVLSLNTQKAYQPGLQEFLTDLVQSGVYDFILLQEAVENVIAPLRNHDAYTILEEFNTEMGGMSHLCIVHRSTYAMSYSTLHSFGMMHPFRKLQHPGFGILMGTFDIPEGRVQIGSLHLHSGWLPHVRVREVLRLKRHLLDDTEPGVPTIFGGDFNLGFPGEVSNGYRLLAPEFSANTRAYGTTLDSRYSEPHHNVINTTAVALARLGLGLKLKTDHFFVDAATAKRVTAERILLDRVSDHSPIELELRLQEEEQAFPVY